MVTLAEKRLRHPLVGQLRWFIRLRYVAAALVIVTAVVHRRWLHWFPNEGGLLAVGVAMAGYNVILSVVHRGLKAERRLEQRLLLIAWIQLLLDVMCITTLVVWTGGAVSPLAGFLALHMVFASLLLPRGMAYAGAGAALAILGTGLSIAGEFPTDRRGVFALAATAVTVPMTVYLANRITRGLRKSRQALIRQNRRIKAMTRQLRRQQEALVQHEKLSAMGQMAAGVTHEIANPLASMDSVLQLMQRRPERLRPEAVATLREQVGRIQQIIRQMKTFAHPDEAQFETVELNAVVEEALAMVRFDKRFRGVELEVKMAPDAGALALMPNAIQQVVVNLVINSLDAMAEVEGPRLIVRTERRDGWCVVEITDNGHGIRPEHMSKLFEPFFTTKPVGKGTGLGLSISYSLIQRQGGSISVRSHPGRYTTFTIRLPIGDRSRMREGMGGGIAMSENPGT